MIGRLRGFLRSRSDRRRPYVAVLLGLESGSVTPLGFVRFRTLAEGWEWADRANEVADGGLTRWVVRRRIPSSTGLE